MTLKHFLLPDAAEGLTEAEILTWHVKPGDEVAVNQIIVEIETAKAAVELPCPWAGRVTELHVQPGDTVEVGTPIITVDVDPDGAAPSEVGGGNGAVTAEAAEEGMKPLVGYGAKGTATKRRQRKTATVTSTVTAVPEPAPAQGWICTTGQAACAQAGPRARR